MTIETSTWKFWNFSEFTLDISMKKRDLNLRINYPIMGFLASVRAISVLRRRKFIASLDTGSTSVLIFTPRSKTTSMEIGFIITTNYKIIKIGWTWRNKSSKTIFQIPVFTKEPLKHWFKVPDNRQIIFMIPHDKNNKLISTIIFQKWS